MSRSKPRVNYTYARYSTDLQSPRSCDDQFRNCEAGRRGKGLAGEFVLLKDEAVSGTDDARENFQFILREAAAGRVGIVDVDELSRLSRGDNTMGFLLDIVAGGGRVIAHLEGLDTDRHGWQMNAGVGQLKNSFAIIECAHRSRRGLEGRAMSTGAAIGDWPYGVRSRPKDPEFDWSCGRKPDREYYVYEPEAEWVRKAFEWSAAGVPRAEVVRRFTRGGAPKSPKSRGKADWNFTQINAMLRNPKYVGEWVWGTRQSVRDSTGKPRSRPQHDKAKVCVTQRPETAIVSQDLFDRTQAALGLAAARHARPGQHPRQLHPDLPLQGVLTCGHCGRLMGRYQIKARGLPHFYCPGNRAGACSFIRYLPARTVVGVVADHLASLAAASSEWLNEYLSAAREGVRRLYAEVPESLRAAEVRLGEAERSAKSALRLATAAGEGSEAEAEYLRAEAEKKRLGAEVQRLTRLAAKQDRTLPTTAQVIDGLRGLTAGLAGGGWEASAALNAVVASASVRSVPGRDGGPAVAELCFRVSPMGVLACGRDADGGRPALEAEAVPMPELRVVLDRPPRSVELVTRVRALRSAGKTWPQVREALGPDAPSARILMQRVREAGVAEAKAAGGATPAGGDSAAAGGRPA